MLEWAEIEESIIFLYFVSSFQAMGSHFVDSVDLKLLSYLPASASRVGKTYRCRTDCLNSAYIGRGEKGLVLNKP